MSDPIFIVAEIEWEPDGHFAEVINEHWSRRYRLHSWQLDNETDVIIAVFEWMPPG